MPKIAIVGARGSGKSDLADYIYDAIPTPRGLVDGYVERFQLKTQLATAQHASYIVNMQIAMFRLGQELEEAREIQTDGGDLQEGHGIVITCGTLLDTSIYVALHAAALANTGEGTFDFNIAADHRSNATMHWLGMMRVDCWDYDHVFHLPLGDKKDPEKDYIAALFDDYVLEAAEAFHIPMLTLDQPTFEERLAKALSIINGNEETDRPTTE